MTTVESDNNIIEFYLDPSLINTDIVKRIGIEKSVKSVIVEVCHQTILQTIDLKNFSTNTIKPLRKDLDLVLTEYQDKKVKNDMINSIVTCINKNIGKISEYCNQADFDVDIPDENDKVENLIELSLSSENLEKLFKDQYGKPYAVVRLGASKQLEILSINSTRFKHYLSNLYRENYNSYISDSSISIVISNLSAEAEFNGDLIPLHLRVAWGSEANRSREDCIYYDMCDILGRIIEISPDGWRLIDSRNDNIVPILFRRYNQQSLIEPDKNYTIDILDKLLNLTNVINPKHRHLMKVYIISALIPEIDHAILTTYGPKGAAKSFLLELIKKLVDPTKPVLLTLHKNIEQFIQQVNHNYINYYDNVKYIPYWLSNEICKAVTGIGHTKRKFYTDDEDIIYEHKRCLGLNGINVALTESDALDRSLIIELEEIEDENRRKEEDLWKEFERIKPQVLGHILDVLSKAMQIKPMLKLEKLPRMADFAEWAEAISQAMGYPPMSFLKAYVENRDELNIVAVNENPVGALVLKYIQDFEERTGPITKMQFEPQELYKKLIDFAENNDIGIVDRNFPKNTASLVKKLKTVIPNLKAVYGIIIEIGRNTITNTSFITISRKKTTIIYKDKLASGGAEALDANSTTLYKAENSKNSNSTTNENTKATNAFTKDIDKNKGKENVL